MTTLKILEKIVADSNVILSVVIGKTALKNFTKTNLEVVTTSFNFDEVIKYIPKMAAKSNLESELLQIQLKLLKIKVYQRPDYQTHFKKAEERIGQRDTEDIDALALALKFRIPIWSNDKDFSIVQFALGT